jgi:hypothetical protein
MALLSILDSTTQSQRLRRILELTSAESKSKGVEFRDSQNLKNNISAFDSIVN